MTHLTPFITRILLLFLLLASLPAAATTPISKEKLLRIISASESGHDWTAQNHRLYIGQWQMGRDAFLSAGYSPKRVGYIFREFHRNHDVMGPEEQRRAVQRWFKHLEEEMAPEIRRYNDKTVCGIRVTKAGILASAHRVGTTNLKIFLRSKHSRYRDRIICTLRKYATTTMPESFV